VNSLPKVNHNLRPRLVHLITSLDVGGTETMLLRTLPLLEKHFQNHVCAIRGRGQIGEQLQQAGIPVYYLDYNNVIDLTAIWRFWRIIQKINPTILITYLIHADLFGRVLGRLFGIPLIISSQRGSPLQWEFLRTFDRLTTYLVDLYTVQTNVAKRQLSKRLHLKPEKMIVIPNGVNLSLYGQAANPSETKKSLALPPDSFVITCVSHLRRGKGQSFLLSAFEQIASNNPNLHLLLVGEGEERPGLESQIKNYRSLRQIHLIGARSNVSSILAASDVFVMPTLAEGMSNAILEAMAAGLPCLVSDIEVNREVIKHGQTGLLFKVKSSPAIAAALSRVITDRQLRQRLGQQARTAIGQRHNIYSISETITDVYQQLINQQNPLPRSAAAPSIPLPSSPLVSIILSVYNGADTLDLCLESITNQSYVNHEIICVDDASTDDTPNILRRWQNLLPNLKIIRNPRNLGLTKSLNKGLAIARGPLVARIDADDQWEPTKLAKQINFLSGHPDYGLIGCYYINTRQQEKYFVRLPTEDFSIRQNIFSMNPFGHSCIVVRKQLLDSVSGYDESVHYGQDLDLWFRLLPLTKMANIDEFLCTRRTDRGISISKTKQQMLQSIKTTWHYLRIYRAPSVNYLWLIRPLAVILTPQTVKHLIYALSYPAPPAKQTV
jgi:glycosyltransferase involved in cell wall biosynthesis